MTYPIYDNVDINKNQIFNLVLHVLPANPGSPVPGQVMYNSVTGNLEYYSGIASAWVTPTMDAASILAALLTVDGTGSGLDADTVDGWETADLIDRANHTGTQTAATISDFDTQVRTSRLDQMASPTGSLSLNSQKITNLATPTAGTDAATMAYVDSIAQGLNPKPGATVASAAALAACTYSNGTSGVGATLTGNANGALTVDGYPVLLNDVVLVKDQASGLQNGLYTQTQLGTGGAPFILTRHASMDTTAEFARASIVVEDAGSTLANSLWVCTNSTAPTVGTTAITFSRLSGTLDYTSGTGITITGVSIAVSAAYQTLINEAVQQPYTATVGNGASTSFNISQATHGQAANGRNYVAVYDASSGDQILCGVTVNNGTGQVTLTFSTAPTTNQFRVVIIGK